MSSSPITPDILGPKVVGYLDWLIEQAESVEGQAALGAIVEDLCQHYRALAICLFSDDGNADDFFQWLLHSPLARKHYLMTVQSKGVGEVRDGRASFVDPVLDAVVAGQWPLARELTLLTSRGWLEGEEYEEDFCFGEFLRCALADSHTEAVLGQWRRALEGGPDPRLNVAEAWAAKDAGELEAALRALLRTNEAKASAMADPNSPSILASNYPFAPNRWVSIEGLAFLALAAKRGISTDYQLERCPAALRAPSYGQFRPRAYPHLALD